MKVGLFSFHGGHSGDFCLHSQDHLVDIVEQYVRSGFTHLGVTEHLPSRPGFLYPEELQTGPDELAARIRRLMTEVRPQLYERFGQRLQLFVGLETEYYGPRPLEDLDRELQIYRPDVIVGSVHHVSDVPFDFSSEEYDRAEQLAGGTEALWCRYFDHQLDLFGLLARYSPTVPVLVGHFDLIKLHRPTFAPTAAIWERMTRNIAAAIAAGLVFDVNARAFKKGMSEPYPSLPILKEIRRQGGSITFGDDSHGTAQVGLHLSDAHAVARKAFDTAIVFERTEGGYEKVAVPF